MKKLLLLSMISLCSCVNGQLLQIPGSIDFSFGVDGNGFAVLDLGGNDVAEAMVIDSQGRILLAGRSNANGTEDFAVARFSATGIIDTSFGPNETGFTLLDLGGTTDRVNAIVLDSQGRILLAGESNANGTADFAVARFSSNGIVDSSFGPDETGFTILPSFGPGSTDIARAIAIDAQGNIILAGQSNANGTVDFAAARLSSDGIIDLNFGPDGTGVTLLDLGGTTDIANAMVLDKQGRILLAGESNATGTNDFAAARLSANGIVDTSFGPDETGFALIDLGGTGDAANALVLDSQGRILLAGESNATGAEDFAVARLSANGIVDLSFGPDETGFTLINLGGTTERAFAVALDSQGRIVLAGQTNAISLSNFGAVRLKSGGLVDPSFGVSGTGFTILPNPGAGTGPGRAVALDSKGGILLGGFSLVVLTNDFAVARLFGEEFNACALALREKYCFLP